MEIIRARPEQAAVLSQIAWKAKAAWRYPTHWMAKWQPTLNVQSSQIAKNHYFVAMMDEQVVGFCGVHPGKPVWQLEHLWVLPEHWSSGVGRRLFFHAVDFARMGEAQGIAIDSDPNAEGFYLRLGASRVGSLETEVDGHRRLLPQLLYPVVPPTRFGKVERRAFGWSNTSLGR